MRSRSSLLFLIVLWLELFAIAGSFAAGLGAPEIKLANAQLRGDLSNAAVEGMVSWVPPATAGTNPITNYEVSFLTSVNSARTAIESLRCAVNVDNANCAITGNLNATKLDVPLCNATSAGGSSLLLVRVIATSKSGEVSAAGERQVQICTTSGSAPQRPTPVAQSPTSPQSPTPSQPQITRTVTTSPSSVPLPPNDTSSVRTPAPSPVKPSVTYSPTPSSSAVASPATAPAAAELASISSLSDQPGGTLFNSPDVAPPITFQPFCALSQSEGAECRKLPPVLGVLPGATSAINLGGRWYESLSNLGSDMSPETRREAKKVIVATVILTQLASVRGRGE